MRLKYFGHATFSIQTDKYKFIIDPFISGNPNISKKVSDIKDIDYIFVTHGHEDHLGDTIDIAKQCNAKVVCNYEIAQYLSKYEIDIHPMHIGGRTKTDFGSIKMTPALHGSGILTEKGIINGGNPGGFVIEVNNKKIYHAGDTGLTMDMKLLKSENIDIALLPIGGNFTMDIKDAVKAVDFIRPKTVIPMHYKTFHIIDVDPKTFKQKVTNSDVKVLDFGQSIDL